MNYIKDQPKTESSYFEIVADAYLFSDKLYLLVLTNDLREMNCNKILKIKITSNGFVPERILKLDSGWYNSICITEDFLIPPEGLIPRGLPCNF